MVEGKTKKVTVLDKMSTKAPDMLSKEEVTLATQEMYVKIEKLHRMMRADNKHSLLIVFQGMDAAGKDGSIDKLYNGLYPMSTEAYGFKAPNEDEASRDFLWRLHKLAPPTGNVCLFNRSHYEDVLVPTVNKLLKKKEINKRYKHINNFEELLEDNNTHVIKFYLHISKKEQLIRFNERRTILRKMWKYSTNDIKVSNRWKDYMEVYETIFTKSKIKWDIIPADQKWYRDHLVAIRVLEKLEGLKMKYPNELN